jgi:hypothetical protein
MDLDSRDFPTSRHTLQSSQEIHAPRASSPRRWSSAPGGARGAGGSGTRRKPGGRRRGRRRGSRRSRGGRGGCGRRVRFWRGEGADVERLRVGGRIESCCWWRACSKAREKAKEGAGPECVSPQSRLFMWRTESWSVSRLQRTPWRVRKLLSSVLPTPPGKRGGWADGRMSQPPSSARLESRAAPHAPTFFSQSHAPTEQMYTSRSKEGSSRQSSSCCTWDGNKHAWG